MLETMKDTWNEEVERVIRRAQQVDGTKTFERIESIAGNVFGKLKEKVNRE